MRVMDADIVVIGTGPAGVCAAVTTARMGAKTILAGNRPVLGGNSSDEIRVWTRGATGGGNLFAEEMGVWGDFKMRGLYVNPEGNPVFWSDVLLDLCLRESNLTLLLNLHVVSVEKEGACVKAVGGWQLDSELEYRLQGRMFIDCTGNATLGHKAGVPFRTGKEASSEYGESFAVPDTATQGNSLLYYVKKCDKKIGFIPPAYAYDMDTVRSMVDQGRVVKEDYSGSDYWWFEYGGNRDTIGDAQEISLELRRLIMGVWNYIKNSGEFDAEHYTLEWVGSYGGKRESRRMITDYVLTQNDLLERRSVYDGAFYGGWYMDFHPSGGFTSLTDSCRQIPVGIYEIPLRCLYNSGTPNLLFAGRDIGASHVAFASSRIMNTCALSGQAAGTAAAWCVQNGVLTDTLDRDAASAIRRILQRDDMLLLSYRNEDPDDLARAAAITASSWFDGSCGPAAGGMPVDKGCFITFPAPERWDARLLLDVSEDTVLRGTYHTSELPSRYLPGIKTGGVEINVKAEKNQWVSLPEPERAKGFVTLALEENPALNVRTESRQRTGLLCGHMGNPVYGYPCIEAAYKRLYAPESVTNGLHRPWMGPNLWIAGGEQEPWIQLTWESVQEIGEVRLYLNPDLSKEIPSSRTEKWADEHHFAARNGMPPELVRAFRLEVTDGGTWRCVYRETQNWRRLVVAVLPEAVRAAALRVVFDGDVREAPPQLFEIRVYRRKTWR